MAKKKIINNEQLEVEQEAMLEESEMEIDSDVESEEELDDGEYDSQETEEDEYNLEDQEEMEEEELELDEEDLELEEEDLELDNDNQEDDEDEFEEGETSESEGDIAEPIAKELGIKEPENQNETVEEQDTEVEKKELEEFDGSEFEEEEAETYGRDITEPGVLTVVNSKKCKRLEIAKCVMKEIGNPKAVRIQLSADKIAISATLPNSENAFKICRNKPKKKVTSEVVLKGIIYKGIIYKVDLIKAITKKFDLDFTDRVCITFHEVEYKMSGDKVVAIITMK
ncbi:hypothetical protein K9O30_01725 [Clostridium bowmanii]|uniref:hypothetical protein n=1 Tax=Clostridium bowmanii TaxID=132925 RepID=UPI001C0D57B2|nr:hypothetical protein [Clostridium bowmanii]MBU3190311.1 hypothetical protein [Clostridium bowmanii]MCA1072477.1 hypothetical protein [Clostridium bowmanii]